MMTLFSVLTYRDAICLQARAKDVPLRVAQISPGVVETQFISDPNRARETYSKFKCLQPEDVAQAVLWILSSPDHVDVNDVLIRPTKQAN